MEDDPHRPKVKPMPEWRKEQTVSEQLLPTAA